MGGQTAHGEGRVCYVMFKHAVGDILKKRETVDSSSTLYYKICRNGATSITQVVLC